MLRTPPNKTGNGEPISSRLRPKQSSTNGIKSPINIKKSTSIKNASKTATINGVPNEMKGVLNSLENRISQLESKKCDCVEKMESKFMAIETEMRALQSKLMERNSQHSINPTISFRDEILVKINQINSEIRAVKQDINETKQGMKQMNKTVPMNVITHTMKGDATFPESMQFLFECMCRLIRENLWIETNFFSIATAFDKKISKLIDKNSKLESMLNDISCEINNSQAHEKFTLSGHDDYDSMSNAIHCVQQQLNKINIMVMQNDETFMKFNNQLHILSAKFVKFNAQINNHIRDFNKQNKNNKIKIGEIIDSDARKFFVMKSNIHEAHKHSHTSGDDGSPHRTVNTYSSGKCATDRFGNIQDIHAYTKCVKLQIQGTSIVNINSFVAELKNYMDNIIGSGIVDNIILNKYGTTGDIISYVEAFIIFQVPIGYQYLNGFKFPTNWHFFERRTSLKMNYRNINRRSTHTNAVRAQNINNWRDTHTISRVRAGYNNYNRGQAQPMYVNNDKHDSRMNQPMYWSNNNNNNGRHRHMY